MVTTDHGRRRGPLHIGADRPFVVVPAETWYAHEQPQRLPQQQSLRTREGAHKGGGHPQGAPLRPERYVNERWVVHMRGCPQGGRAPTRGAPTARTICQRALVCAHERAPTRGEGTHKGCPYGPERYGNERWVVHMRGCPQGGRARTRGAPTARTICQRALGCAYERVPTRGEGTHKGCPYGPNDMASSAGLCAREGAHKGGGHPQGVPLRPKRYGFER